MAEEKKVNNDWPVLPETVITAGARGYRQWLTQALAAVLWARTLPGVQADRLGTFGTSQGGGTALLLGSLLTGYGVKAVAADLPFLTNFPAVYLMKNRGAYELAFSALEGLTAAQQHDAWRALGYIDTLSHAHRLTLPVLLTAGSVDDTTPKETIRSLFDQLPGIRSFTEIAGQGHAYTVPFIPLVTAWFGMYV
jgi:cephalosporin-C deacetylase-like acetyl esterase